MPTYERNKMSVKKNIYHFTLVLNGVNEKTKKLEDILFKAGCDDALINFRNGTVYLDFDRESYSFEDAIISAISQVESTKLNIKVVSAAPDHYVSESEVAKRLRVKRQTVSLWFKGVRLSHHPFPAQIMKLSEKSPLWRWFDIVEWLYTQKKITDTAILEQAKLLEHLNVALLERAVGEKQYRQKLLKKLSH